MEFTFTLLGLIVVLLYILRLDARYPIIAAVWYIILSVKIDVFSIAVASILSFLILFLPKMIRLAQG